MKKNSILKRSSAKNSKKIKVLVVSTKMPYITSGAPVRDYNLLKGLSSVKKNEVNVISFFDEFSKKYISKVKRNLNVQLFPIPKPKEYNLFKKAKEIANGKLPHPQMLKNSPLSKLILDKKLKPDIIQLEELDSFFLTERILNRFTNAKVILDAHNVEFVTFKSELDTMSPLKKYLGYMTLPNFKKEEINALKRVDHIFACSEIDKAYFSDYVPKEKITVVPNGVDSGHFKPAKFVKEPVIFFFGFLSYLPNEDALNFYFSSIHPEVKKRIKNVKVYIVGKDPPEWLKKMSKIDPSIIVTGYVEDVRDYINRARVCICPLRYGSGTRLKILEYMASGKPVVSTKKGSEGLDAVNNKELIIADSQKKFAGAVIELLKNDNLCKKLGNNARKLIETKYDWRNINQKLNRVYENLIKMRGKEE